MKCPKCGASFESSISKCIACEEPFEEESRSLTQNELDYIKTMPFRDLEALACALDPELIRDMIEVNTKVAKP